MQDRRGDDLGRSRAGRVLVAKLGLDGHDVGAKFVARLLRDSGFEVVYLGIRQTPEAVVRAAVDEDVDVVGLSMLSGSHGALVERVLNLLGGVDEDPPPVVLGGLVPPEDHEHLTGLGVRAIFSAGTPVSDMVDAVRELAAERRGTTPNEEFVGRVEGQDSGYDGETGAEARATRGR